MGHPAGGYLVVPVDCSPNGTQPYYPATFDIFDRWRPWLSTQTDHCSLSAQDIPRDLDQGILNFYRDFNELKSWNRLNEASGTG